ncbi:MAG: Ni/Fe-hydrogenase, b-type cytochrome subunit [Deltaproteobacteria bacterium]|nr:MAG: Ni/Fe-hydrogenase, b-type cytochrome subunit [Deltaproteobacteria bacterium]
MQYERHLTWSILLRLYHWMFALSIVTLVVTGLYIHDPWTTTVLEGGNISYPMSDIRFIHFIAGFVFTGAMLIRIFLIFFGNRQERFWDWLPLHPTGIKNLFQTILHYAYVKDDMEHKLGHNTMAGTSYLITFLVALMQIISGFYMLYPESPFWMGWGGTLLGSQQWGRFLHYLAMWWFMMFPMIHIYLCVWNDVYSKEGLISSIFNGVKYTPSNH